jgi:CheY-like chemotaxis protein
VCRVVIAEDEVVLAMTLRRQLEARGIDVVGLALNGQVALDLCRETQPDAVLMDLRMPVMDGFEATRRIMAECPTRVIVVTAMDAPGTRSKAEAAGAARFLTKPVNPEAVLEAIGSTPRPSAGGVRCRSRGRP